MVEPEVGSRHLYTGTAGLGEVLVGRSLSAEMRELDMPPGTDVTVVALVPAADTGAHDNLEDSVVVTWSDRSGNPRQTSIGIERFDELFEPASGA